MSKIFQSFLYLSPSYTPYRRVFLFPGKLTDGEFEIVKSHAIRGVEQVKDKLKLFKEGVELVKHHHEFYDGTGYPDGLNGDGIPLWARIVCVVDSYQSMIEKTFQGTLFRGEGV